MAAPTMDLLVRSLRQEQERLKKQAEEKAAALIQENDTVLKHWLDRYKYADRYPEMDKRDYQQRCEHFIQTLEQYLGQQTYLCSHHFGLADAAILPFVRQFAFVDKQWFAETPYPKVKHWLHAFLHSPIFLSVMNKYPQWHTGDTATFFPTTADL